MVEFICYPKCTTCQKARKWLDDNQIEYEFRDIKLDNPTLDELTDWRKKSGLPLKKLFNTSGLLYKALDHKNKLPTMSEDEMLHLLSSDGMLVKRPLLIGDSFFLPKGNTFEVALPEKRSFNTLMLSEGIELGHKVTKIKASALVDGKWQELFAGDIIGYKLAERFDTVVSDRVRVELSYLDTPVLRDFGLYLFEESLADTIKKSNKNLAKSESAVIEVGNKEIDVNLGGLFPFNTVKVEGVPNNSYKLYVFNGTNFDLYAQGESVDGKINAKFDLPVDNAYRLNVKFDKEIEKDVKIEVTLS